MIPRRLSTRLSFGGRVPWAIGLVLVVTIALSLLVAFGDRHVGSLFERIALVPEAVWRGHVWRLLTWAFIEPGPLALIFGCLFLYWFGGDLARAWGSARFLRVYLGVIAASAAVTCAIARVDRDVLEAPYIGGWATAAALTVAWGLWFPDRVIRIYFVLPIRGAVVAWLTIAVTLVLAVYSGWERFVPELAAEGTMLAWLFRQTLFARFAKVRRSYEVSRDARRRETVKRQNAKKRAGSVAYLRLVESHDDDPPDLPPEVDAKLDRLLRGRSNRNGQDD